MELLLLLTAFFASLTGSGSGDRDPRAVPGVAVVQAAQAAQAAVQPARVAKVATGSQALHPQRAILPPGKAAPLASLPFPFERRLE